MHKHTKNKTKCLRRLGRVEDSAVYQDQYGRPPNGKWPRAATHLACLLLILFATRHLSAQDKSGVPFKDVKSFATVPVPQRTPSPPANRPITLNEAVTIFLQQNLQLVAARYDIDLVDAEKLTAGLRPNPEIEVAFSEIPFNGGFYKPQSFEYGVSQTFELGGKRQKRIAAANADSEVARAQFQIVAWQLTNDVKKKFYAVLLAESLLKLAKENQETFAEVVKRTNEVFRLGEISGLDLQRLEVEKFKFDTDVANSERDFELALRDLRFVLGGDYRAMNIEVAGSIEYYEPYDFSLSDLRDKAMAARPDLKAAQLSERAANASIKLQNSQKIPDLTLGAGIEELAMGGSTYNVGFSIPIPIFNRNQTERAKALIQRRKAQNDQQYLANQVASEVEKALVAFEIQKRRVELYRTGVLTKVTDIQTSTEYALKAGESSILELLDAIRTRRDTLAGFYQTIFDYQMSLLDLELATATPLQK
jgi:cobalt-zinc-cadmium efflux system outer membrane protein